MRYLLAVLSHGYPESDTAERCLDSFLRYVAPAPAWTVRFHDGPGFCYIDPALASASTEIRPRGEKLMGFCDATRGLWRSAVSVADTRDCEYVFWLEHDFIFTRPVDLWWAWTLLHEPKIAQVQLMRQPVNEQERARGHVLTRGDEGVGTGMLLGPHGSCVWLQHQRYFTTNPSLMRTEFMRRHPWPEGPECEGRFGLRLAEHDYRYAVLGEGEPWVEHVGLLRTGKGY